MPTPTMLELERYFQDVIEQNRKQTNDHPCARSALSAHAFFCTAENLGVDDLHVPDDLIELPFDQFWIVTSVIGTPICGLIEGDGKHFRVSLYLGYGAHRLPRHLREERRNAAEKILWRMIDVLRFHQTEAYESSVQASINRGRTKTVGRPSYIPALPPFIRITNKRREPSGHKGGTHASPIPHDRRGHWRTYKASGKRVWVNHSKIHGGSAVARNYLIT